MKKTWHELRSTKTPSGFCVVSAEDVEGEAFWTLPTCGSSTGEGSVERQENKPKRFILAARLHRSISEGLKRVLIPHSRFIGN